MLSRHKALISALIVSMAGLSVTEAATIDQVDLNRVRLSSR